MSVIADSFKASMLKLGMNDHLISADIHIRIFWIFSPKRRFSQAMKLTLSTSHLQDAADVPFGYPDIHIRILQIFSPRSRYLQATYLKLYISHLQDGADILHHSDIRIPTSGFFGQVVQEAATYIP